MDGVRLNIDKILDELTLEIAQLKRELIIERARNAALIELQEAEKVQNDDKNITEK